MINSKLIKYKIKWNNRLLRTPMKKAELHRQQWTLIQKYAFIRKILNVILLELTVWINTVEIKKIKLKKLKKKTAEFWFVTHKL